MDIHTVIMMVVFTLILGILIQPVADNTIGLNRTKVNESESSTWGNAINVTGATSTMVNLVPVFLMVAAIIGIVGYIRKGK